HFYIVPNTFRRRRSPVVGLHWFFVLSHIAFAICFGLKPTPLASAVGTVDNDGLHFRLISLDCLRVVFGCTNQIYSKYFPRLPARSSRHLENRGSDFPKGYHHFQCPHHVWRNHRLH